MAEPVSIAVFARAPVPQAAKTRLIPALGPDGAARLAARLVRRATLAAIEAGIGPVTLWCAPDTRHPEFQSLAAATGVRLRPQTGEDLGARMAAAFARTKGPLLLIGADCPSLDAARLRRAAEQLSRCDILIDPAEDGGYGLIGGNLLPESVFSSMPWSTPEVAGETRRRAAALGLTLAEGPVLRDLDTPADLDWWRRRAPSLFHEADV
jgi:rSAM/selenodomain-associated transferase 1